MKEKNWAGELEQAITEGQIRETPVAVEFEPSKDGSVDISRAPSCNEINTIYVKLSVKSESFVPAGIRHRPRTSDKQVDRNHADKAEDMGQSELAKVGRERPGRVDTGEHVIDNMQNVQVATVRRALANNGWYLQEAYTYTKRPPTGGTYRKGSRRPTETYVVVLQYKRHDPSIHLEHELQEDLRELGRITWQYLHVWRNPDGTLTVNCGGPSFIRPRYGLVVRDGKLKPIPLKTALLESEE